MTTVCIPVLLPDPYLIEARSGFFERLLCEHGMHNFSRWVTKDATITQGRRILQTQVQERECIRPSCGVKQRRFF